MMECVNDIAEMQQVVRDIRAAQQTIAFVPTMGNLHAGHLTLIQTAKQHADKIIVSIFVNPLQFGINEDFATYPRTPEADLQKLQASDVDVVFMPEIQAFYTDPKKHARVFLPEISKDLCGKSRPDFFEGVTTVVMKLFQLMTPNVAIFGEKDYQQLFIIKKMVNDFLLPIKIIGQPIVRDVDGLALSSRNQYLSSQERKIAPKLYQILTATKEKLLQGEIYFEKLQQQASEQLTQFGFRTDYFSIRRQTDLNIPEAGDKHLVILAAAYLGRTRLIDNVKC